MNYFSWHIGDYAAHTRHLTPMEDLAYRRLLDAYYLHEKPLVGGTSDIARQICLRDHLAEVEAVLTEFFESGPEGWRNRRCDAEIAKYKSMVEAGREGAAKRWAKVAGENRGAMATQCPPHGHPNRGPLPTNNQEPRTMNQQMDGCMETLSLVSQKENYPSANPREGVRKGKHRSPAEVLAAQTPEERAEIRARLEASRMPAAARSGVGG